MSTGFVTRNKVQSLDRALDILKLLGSEPEMRVTDLARRLEVHKSTAFRLLSTLEEHGLVEQNPTTEKYRLGYGLVRLASAVVGEIDLARASRPVLEELAARTSETVNLAILQGEQVVNIDQIAAPNLVVNVNWVGKQTPLHCTSMGKFFSPSSPTRSAAGCSSSHCSGSHRGRSPTSRLWRSSWPVCGTTDGPSRWRNWRWV